MYVQDRQGSSEGAKDTRVNNFQLPPNTRMVALGNDCCLNFPTCRPVLYPIDFFAPVKSERQVPFTVRRFINAGGKVGDIQGNVRKRAWDWSIEGIGLICCCTNPGLTLAHLPRLFAQTYPARIFPTPSTQKRL